MNKKRVFFLSLLVLSGCNNYSPATKIEKQTYTYDDKVFATKTLSQVYLRKKLHGILSPTVNSGRLVREISFANYKHRDLLKDVIADTTTKINDKTFFEIIDSDAAVAAKKSDSTFLEYINYINPAPNSDFALEEDTVTSTSFRARWTAVANATSYNLYVNGSLYGTVTGTTQAVTGRSTNTGYTYYIVAASSTGTTTTSQTISTTTLPAAPTVLTAAGLTQTSFQARWTTPDNAIRFNLIIDNDINNPIQVTGATTYNKTGLAPGTNHSYYVQAVNDSGSSTNSGSMAVSTNPLIFSTWDPTNKSENFILAQNNLQGYTNSGYGQVYGTVGVSTGKWYWEGTLGSNSNATCTLIGFGGPTSSYTYYAYLGDKYGPPGDFAYGPPFNSGDVIGVALDLTNKTIAFYKNGTYLGIAFSGITAETYKPFIQDGCGGFNTNVIANFGQSPFAYPVPAGYNPGVYQ